MAHTSHTILLHLQRLPRCPHQALRTTPHRHASSASTKGRTLDKSRILSKPTRFNPPSHASRRIRPKMYPGPDLNASQRAEQATKKYPNMFPPEGSWGFWFLTQRRLHVWITLVSLSTRLGTIVCPQNKTYASSLPPPNTAPITVHTLQSRGLQHLALLPCHHRLPLRASLLHRL